MLHVDVDDLGFHFLTFGQHVFGLADAAVSDLGNVDQAVDAGDDFSESTEVHELDHLNGSNVAHVVLLTKDGPGVVLSGLVTQGDLLLFGIVGDDENVNLVAHSNNVSGALDVVPAQFGNMDHAVHTADINESTVGSQALDSAFVLLTDFDFTPDLFLSSLAGLVGHGLDGADHTTAGTVDFQDLHLLGGLHQLTKLAASGDAGGGSGDEDTDALVVSDNAALVFFSDEGFDDGLFFADGFDVIPDLAGVQTLLGQHDGAFHVVDADNSNFHFVADLQDFFGLDGGISGKLIHRDVAGVLGTQIHLDLGGADGRNDTGNLISIIQSLDGLLEKLSKILLSNSFNSDFFVHSGVDLLYYPRRRRCACRDADGSCSGKQGQVQIFGTVHQKNLLTALTANSGEFSGIGTFSVSDDHHGVTVLCQFHGFILPFFRSLAYCIKDFAVCTHFFCDFTATFP